MIAGPERRLRLLTVALFVSLLGCSAEVTAPSFEAGVRRVEEPNGSTPAAGSLACMPRLTLTESGGDPLPPVTCPDGWTARERSSALPVSGRFTTARDLVETLCTRDATSDVND